MVRNRTTKGRPNPPQRWIWSPRPTHPAIVTREMFDATQQPTGRERSRAGHSPSTHPGTQHIYTLRGYIRCGICGRRLTGATRGGHNATTYNQCGLDTADPRTASRYPTHPKAVLVREDAMLATITGFFITYIFSPDRAAHLTHVMPAATAHASEERDQQRQALEHELARIQQAQDNLITELETAPADDTAVGALRTRIRARFAQLEQHRKQTAAGLDDLSSDPEPADDPALLDEIPQLGDWLTQAPGRIQQQVYDAFDLHIRCDRPGLTATLTDATPAGSETSPGQTPPAAHPPTASPDSHQRTFTICQHALSRPECTAVMTGPRSA